MCDHCAAHNGGGHDHSHDGGQGHTHGEADHTHGGAPVRSIDPSTVVGTDETLRIAITGKGGVGKSTIAAAIASELAGDDSQTVLALDADPDMNLATTLDVASPPPITEQGDLIADRAGSGGGLVSLTPDVADVLDSHATAFGESGRLVTIGAPAGANTGCMCPENNFVRSLVRSALDVDHLVMDLEAGVEHLGRGTADDVDVMLVVVEPSRAAIETAHRVRDLADDLGIPAVRAVINKDRGDADAVASRLDIPVLATLGYDEDVSAAALSGESPVESSPALRGFAEELVAAFESVPAARSP